MNVNGTGLRRFIWSPCLQGAQPVHILVRLYITILDGMVSAVLELPHRWRQELSIGQAEKDGKMPFLIYKKLRRSLKWQKFITKKNAA